MDKLLEPKSGAEVIDGSPDGLYLYRAEERRNAAQWLHDALERKINDTFVEKVMKKLGGTNVTSSFISWVVDQFSDITDDVANQVCNTFASDWADTAAKDSENWKEVSDSLAVSPDNTMLWDPPSKGGVYGYAIPASYTAGLTEVGPRFVWKRVPNKGTLHGNVFYNQRLAL